MNQIVLKARKVVGGTAEGEALVAKRPISTWGGVDAVRGIITERKHHLNNQSFADKVLVFPSAKGSSGWSTVAQVIRLAGKAPKAMIIGKVNSLSAMGALVMRVPTVTDLDSNPVDAISTGDWVKIDADQGLVTVTPSKLDARPPRGKDVAKRASSGSL
jgi:predicted aconitase with swiveling domain